MTDHVKDALIHALENVARGMGSGAEAQGIQKLQDIMTNAKEKVSTTGGERCTCTRFCGILLNPAITEVCSPEVFISPRPLTTETWIIRAYIIKPRRGLHLSRNTCHIDGTLSEGKTVFIVPISLFF